MIKFRGCNFPKFYSDHPNNTTYVYIHIYSAFAKGSSACRALAKIVFYALAVSNSTFSTWLRKPLRHKERRIDKNREIPRKTFSSFKSNSCPLDSKGTSVDWEHWGFTLSLCHCTKSMLCGFDNVVWWFICQVMVVFCKVYQLQRCIKFWLVLSRYLP